MSIAVIDYQSGNIASVANGLDMLGTSYQVTADPEKIKRADRVIFPGVGRAAPAMEVLRQSHLDRVIQEIRAPFLGICLGIQLLLPFSEEDDTPCLGIVEGQVRRFITYREPASLRVPQIGWNKVSQTRSDPLFRGVPDGAYFYFVNSYYVETDDMFALGETRYGREFVSVLRKDNFYGVQFHPEKSGAVGLTLLRNFCDLRVPLRDEMMVIPAMDILDGACVRLTRGDYTERRVYSDDLFENVHTLERRGARLIHIIDLNGAREGMPVNAGQILEIAQAVDVPIQVGGGIRRYEDAQRYLEGGVKRVILGTSAIADPPLIRRLIDSYGEDRVAVAVDSRDGVVAIKGWQEMAQKTIFDFLDELKPLGVRFVLLTDINRDGTLTGPNDTLIRKVVAYPFEVMVAGGVSCDEDVQRLRQIGPYGVVVGKALYEGRVTLERWMKKDRSRQGTHKGGVSGDSYLAKRVIPCMDIKEGRVVKGTSYVQLRDAGDPVELGKLYSDLGADELVFLDIMATVENRETLYNLVRRIARNINIPFTVGGGIRSLDTIRNLLKCGADKVSIGTAAVRDPDFVRAAAEQFGSQCIVISIDPKRVGDHWEIYINGGRDPTGIDALTFVGHMEACGAGELLVNSLDRDGRRSGYDIELLRAVSEKVTIPIIASSGAGTKEHFLEALVEGRADAVLAASLFHFRELEIPDLKTYLREQNIPVRS
jgi:phosphoribosylformimino-5-aminoimidazole carboxamide ribotide isomerase/imidazole glycerol phosphate synthase glutamine amidotransferase subunit